MTDKSNGYATMHLALERIAREDYRGPEPESVRLAREALAAVCDCAGCYHELGWCEGKQEGPRPPRRDRPVRRLLAGGDSGASS